MEEGEKEMKHFITFEGIDGSGKSTIAQRVYEKLQEQNYDVVLTVEPTDSPVGTFVKQCISTNADPFVTAFTFIADRVHHCTQIKQWIDEEKIVLCDRYADSTYAYQGVQLASQLDDPVRWLKDLSKQRVLIPERTFFFSITPDIALQRIQHRSELIPFERKEFLTKVAALYEKLTTEHRFLTLDATQSIDDLTNQCVTDILEQF